MTAVHDEQLPAAVFQAIVARYSKRADDIARFAASGYSFEEWLNWEAFAGCLAAGGWEVHAKPAYRGLGVDYGDLLVVADGGRVLVEIGLVHDGTGDKWRAKLDWNVQKLARPLPGVVPLQVIVLVSGSDISASESWQCWLNKVPCWCRRTNLSASISLPPSGTMIIRGWR